MVDDSYYTRNSKKNKPKTEINEDTFLCPGCADPMRKILAQDETAEDYIIDFCTGCAGVWLDQGELQKAVKMRKGIPVKILNLAPYKDINERIAEGQRKCPRCSQLLEVKRIHDINIDLCLECGGLFLDQHELYDLVCDTKQSKGIYTYTPSNGSPDHFYRDMQALEMGADMINTILNIFAGRRYY